MGEFTFFEDWDLQAIVRGCSGEGIPAVTTMEDNLQSNFSHSSSTEQDDLFFTYPETTTVFDELEELYKPFYPVLHPLSTQTLVTSSMSVPKEVREPEKLLNFQVSDEVKCKRSSKKNNYKRAVKQVTADSLCSDTWSWRKYGQKPIKGSPYPRSYYRCSSSKGCSARKQVERSCLDPGVFIITYTAEHNHPDNPIRRRNKLMLPASPKRVKTNESCSPNSKVDSEVIKTEEEDLLNQHLEEDVDATNQEMPDILMGMDADDWFPSIEELNGLFMQEVKPASDCCFMDQFSGTLADPEYSRSVKMS
ncbi:putative WRKY family transcription factor [Quillaja saponaria]|uniref:WRKY family transcription factor n=1 Tax=Quillaja saponaria TaxID=32244 RepID=A0AAD7L632_QUISA|nr:putative WRKY family transcription factor [Quillaja saponaria]